MSSNDCKYGDNNHNQIKEKQIEQKLKVDHRISD